jgi:hypothetical protein
MLSSAPKGWRQVTTPDFTFLLPTDMVLNPNNAPDSRIVQYQDDKMIVTFDKGAMGGERLDSLKKYPNFTSEMEVIHGVGVQLVTFDIPPGPGHRFDYAAAASYRGTGMTVYIHCKTREDYQTATKIFKSVKSRLF